MLNAGEQDSAALIVIFPICAKKLIFSEIFKGECKKLKKKQLTSEAARLKF